MFDLFRVSLFFMTLTPISIFSYLFLGPRRLVRRTATVLELSLKVRLLSQQQVLNRR
jgi:hypothetical protein